MPAVEEQKEREEKEEGEKEKEGNRQDMTKKVYGDYEILKAIGKGKFAVVYRAKRQSDDEIVALKRISVDTVDNKTREKCLKEVKLLQSLDHPNIIRYLDSFINENDLVIVFEWAAAGDLKRQLRKAQEKETPFEERIIWKYFSQIADAIQHMHERRIMHRDLKPANIFLTLDGTVKLGDLGLSRELSENTIQAHSKVGTPLYMSPEVLRGDGYDFKSDIWSIGCLLYELAVLKSPFKSEGLNLYSLFQKISKGEYSPISERYSEELRSLAYSMISTNSEDRPEISYICEVASRMRTKYTDEYVKQRRMSKQREREAIAAKVSEDKSEETAEDKSVTSNASSKTASRHKSNPNQRHRGVRENEDRFNGDRDYESNENRKRHENGLFKNSEHKSDRDESHESSYPPLQKITNDKNDENVNKVNNLMGALKGDEYHTYSNNAASVVVPEPGNRFNEQSLGHSASSRDSNEWGSGKRGKKKDKSKNRMDNSHGSSNENISLPRNNLNGHEDENRGGVFSHSTEPHSSRSSPRRKANEDYHDHLPHQDNSHHQNYSVPRINNNHSRNSESSYAIPLADQQDNTFHSRKPDIKVHRRKKSLDEIGDSHSSHRKGSGHKRSSKEYTPPKSSHAKYIDDDNLGTASPLQVHPFSSTMPSANAYLMSGIALAQMEILYAKLTLLKYPVYIDKDTGGHGVMNCRICPYHFAGDLTSILGRRAHEFPHAQFHTFVQVAEWLIKKANGNPFADSPDIATHSTLDVYNDSPNTIAKQLLKMAQDCGVTAQALTEISPTSLSNGHGDNACIYLNLIADIAVQKNSKKQVMVYPSDMVEDNGPLDFNQDVDGDDGVIEEEDMLDLDVIVEPDPDDSEVGSHLFMSMIVGEVDSKQWKEETERVASKLSAGQSNNLKKNFTSWASHVQTFQKHADSVLSQSLDDMDGGDVNEDAIPTLLRSVQKSVLEGISGIARAESMLNNKKEFSDASIEYAKIKQDLDHLEVLSGLSGKNIVVISEKLAEVQELVQEMTEKLDEKTGENDEEGRGSIVSLKRAIKRIKEESRDMHLTTGMLQQQVMSHRINQAAANRKKSRRKRGGSNYSKRRGRPNDDDLE